MAFDIISYVLGVVSTVAGSWINTKIQAYHTNRVTHLEDLKQRLAIPLYQGLHEDYGPLMGHGNPVVTAMWGKVSSNLVVKLIEQPDRYNSHSLLELFEKKNVALISVAESLDTSTAAGRLVITIMGAVSQWEREAIGERTREALRHKKTKGERVGNIPFGFRLSPDGRRLEADVVEQDAMIVIGKLRAQGHSLRRIAVALNRQGHRTRCGSAWRLESVNRIIHRTATST